MDKSQYKNVYVFVEQRDGVVQNVALELLEKPANWPTHSMSR